MVAAAVIGSTVVGAVGSSMAADSAEEASQYAVDANRAAADRQAALAERQYNDYLQYFQPALLAQMNQSMEGAAAAENRAQAQFEQQAAEAARMSQRYWGVQVPLEDQMIQQARNYNTEAERDRMAAEARGDVAMAFDSQRDQMNRELGRMGVNPNDGRGLAMRQQSHNQEALATASAANKTREAARQIGWSRLGEVAALGRGLPGFNTTSSQIALGWSNSGLQAANAGMNNAVAASNANNGAYQTASNMYSQSGQSAMNANNAYNSALQTAYNSPLMSSLGGTNGLLLGAAGRGMGLA